jgi:hypothetical protein
LGWSCAHPSRRSEVETRGQRFTTGLERQVTGRAVTSAKVTLEVDHWFSFSPRHEVCPIQFQRDSRTERVVATRSGESGRSCLGTTTPTGLPRRTAEHSPGRQSDSDPPTAQALGERAIQEQWAAVTARQTRACGARSVRWCGRCREHPRATHAVLPAEVTNAALPCPALCKYESVQICNRRIICKLEQIQSYAT